ncbi:Protein of unknown function [Pedobacter westerhofensis]|uniref:DUF3828 domain-containing protein n=1 Tax=Pedobacter westerhofensis TaxID=425512 RepID=A0A521FT56_9SPHI|nr:Protein of unknown function [Pedobacter westerhofensis]
MCIITLATAAQPIPPDKGVTMLKGFYTAYITASSQDADPKKMEQELSALRKKYCTTLCLKQFKMLVKQTDADPIIKAQDMDLRVLQTLAIKQDPRKANRYSIKYSETADSHETTTIYVMLKQENGILKIAYLE